MSSNPYQAPTTIDEPIEATFIPNRIVRSPYLAAWMIFRQQGLKMAACYLWVWVPVGLLLAYLDNYVIDAEDFQMTWRLEQNAQLWFGVIADGAIYAIAIASMKRLSSTTDEPIQASLPTVGSAMGIGFVRYWRMWTTRFCVNLILILGLLLLIIPGVYFYVRSILADAIAVEEKVNGPTAISRSMELTNGQFWPSAGIGGAIIGLYLATLIGIMSVYIPLIILVEDSFWIMWIDFAVTMVMMIPVVTTHCLSVAWYQTLKLNR